NLGYLHSTKGEPREAIHYYEEVANDNDVKLIEKIAATTSLIKEYYHLEEYEKAEKMVEKSTELLEAKHQNEEHKYFYYVTYTYDFDVWLRAIRCFFQPFSQPFRILLNGSIP